MVNVITTSIGGEDAVTGAARFKADVLPYKPDLIFIDYGLNDRRRTIAADAIFKTFVVAKGNTVQASDFPRDSSASADSRDSRRCTAFSVMDDRFRTWY